MVIASLIPFMELEWGWYDGCTLGRIVAYS